MKQRIVAICIALLALGTPGPLGALAQGTAAYPSRPIRMIVPFSAGGPTDILARALAEEFPRLLGQSMIVENRLGAGGNLGAEIAARSPPDGYTLVMGASGAFAINVTLFPKLPYDVVRDFAPVSLATILPMVLVVHPSLPVKTVRELIDLARTRQLSYGSAGNGTSIHLSTEMFNAITGINMAHVPYKGVSQAMLDLVGGQYPLMFSDAMTALPQVNAGKLRAVAITTPSPLYPGVPTFIDSGIAGYDPSVWYGVFAPAGTPKDIVNRLAAAIAKGLQTPQVRDRLAAMGARTVGSTPEEFGEFVKAEIARWAKVVKASGARVD